MVKLKKGSAKAKAWGRRMKALRTKSVTRVKRKRRVSTMARRKTRVTRRRRASSSLNNKLMNGVFPMKGLISQALAGIAVSEVSEQVAPKVIPYQNLIGAGLVGGLPGVAGAFAFNMLQGKGVTNTQGTGITFY